MNTTGEAAPRKRSRGGSVARFVDDRVGGSGIARFFMNKIFPDHWSFMLGEIALYSFVVLILTGIYLTLFFIPSTRQVVYHGPYRPLDGMLVPKSYASTLQISFTVRGGLVARQMHHWAADIFIAAIVAHMLRIFFTGGFRRPREINWVVGITLLVLAIANGFLGYSLPDDLVSGTGIRIAYSIFLSVPVVGTWLAVLLFGGNYPGHGIIGRFYTLHILVIPAVIAGLLGLHMFLLVRQKHTQFPGPGRTNRNVVGSPMWPTYAAKAGGFFFLVTAVIAGLGGLVQINPIWLYGPYIPYHVSYAVQPDWYMAWIDGALRLMPSWETVFAGHMIPNVFYPGVLMPGITFTVMALWPWLEDRFTKESATEHHLLDRPRDRPVRTAFGAAVLGFYTVLFFASATDLLAKTFGVSLNTVLVSGRIALFVVPVVTFPVTYKICKEMSGASGIGKRKRALIVQRTADGAYVTVEAPPRPTAGPAVEELEPVALPDEVRWPSHAAASGEHHDGHDAAGEPELVGVGVAEGSSEPGNGSDGRRSGSGGGFLRVSRPGGPLGPGGPLSRRFRGRSQKK
jgi:ubiquinol-cytochrome c reductase cytochrome b subunit